jgi:hypothetical protein
MDEIEIDILVGLKDKIDLGIVEIISSDKIVKYFEDIKSKYSIGIGAINWHDRNLLVKLGELLTINEKIEISRFILKCFISNNGIINQRVTLLSDAVLSNGYSMPFEEFLNNIHLFLPLPLNIIIVFPNGKILNYNWHDEIFFG